jgi:hypothetical protein
MLGIPLSLGQGSPVIPFSDSSFFKKEYILDIVQRICALVEERFINKALFIARNVDHCARSASAESPQNVGYV